MKYSIAIYVACLFMVSVSWALPSSKPSDKGLPSSVSAVQGAVQSVNLKAPSESPANLTEGHGDGNDTLEFDFVNLPGYGVVDEANSTENSSFTCYERRYGYYADIEKDCMMFHLCYPVRSPYDNDILYQRFSFVCSDEAVFDQQHLVCVENDTLSINCSDSGDYFESSNDKLIESLQQSQKVVTYSETGEELSDKSNITASGSEPLTESQSYGFFDSWFG